MNRLLRIVLLLVALWVLAPLTVGPALADPIGGVIVTPGTGNNLGQMRLRTFASYPAQENAYYGLSHGPRLRFADRAHHAELCDQKSHHADQSLRHHSVPHRRF